MRKYTLVLASSSALALLPAIPAFTGKSLSVGKDASDSGGYFTGDRPDV